eukprot:gnl/TRDRNA2_/TRDRNA2_210400_c0_seq1.p1 gnl/TRDRNA2_/TRDRNA2_210400_c0~~gnl/TRDRNA2_/TRDRNA2_210400_c0_seq1.p1  ORF type:complete len:240 (-),score=33.59 gnl/TRDRNA2_/TRDRNA2_210400_c0_seq1:55-732(-)
MDSRGHGLSDKPAKVSDYGMNMVREQFALMDHLGIQRAHLSGASMGAEIAIKTAVIQPERVSSLIISGSGWSHDFAGDKVSWYSQSYASFTNPCTIWGCIIVTSRLCWYPCCCSCIWMSMQGEVPDVKACLACAAGMNEVLEVSEQDLRRSLSGDVKIPMHGIVGEKDMERKYVERLGSLIGDAWTLTVVPGKDHDGLFVDPLWSTATVEFITKCAAPVSGIVCG